MILLPISPFCRRWGTTMSHLQGKFLCNPRKIGKLKKFSATKVVMFFKSLQILLLKSKDDLICGVLEAQKLLQVHQGMIIFEIIILISSQTVLSPAWQLPLQSYHQQCHAVGWIQPHPQQQHYLADCGWCWEHHGKRDPLAQCETLQDQMQDQDYPNLLRCIHPWHLLLVSVKGHIRRLKWRIYSILRYHEPIKTKITILYSNGQ